MSGCTDILQAAPADVFSAEMIKNRIEGHVFRHVVSRLGKGLRKEERRDQKVIGAVHKGLCDVVQFRQPCREFARQHQVSRDVKTVSGWKQDIPGAETMVREFPGRPLQCLTIHAAAHYRIAAQRNSNEEQEQKHEENITKQSRH